MPLIQIEKTNVDCKVQQIVQVPLPDKPFYLLGYAAVPTNLNAVTQGATIDIGTNPPTYNDIESLAQIGKQNAGIVGLYYYKSLAQKNLPIVSPITGMFLNVKNSASGNICIFDFIFLGYYID